MCVLIAGHSENASYRGAFKYAIRIRLFTGNSILGTGWRHSFAADDAEPSHHFAQESPQPGNLINLIANAYEIGLDTRYKEGPPNLTFLKAHSYQPFGT
ncbi:MAG TPA: hypothetical protein VK463_03160, partial [Desulfomonilaceae bacterium]|nr:hypothetical protein [Desulfomonilaceae bacterium]